MANDSATRSVLLGIFLAAAFVSLLSTMQAAQSSMGKQAIDPYLDETGVVPEPSPEPASPEPAAPPPPPPPCVSRRVGVYGAH